VASGAADDDVFIIEDAVCEADSSLEVVGVHSQVAEVLVEGQSLNGWPSPG